MGTVFAERVIDVLALILLLALSGLLVLRGRVGAELMQLELLAAIVLAVLIAGVLALRYGGPRVIGFFSARIQAYYSRFQHGVFNSFQDLPVVGPLDYPRVAGGGRPPVLRAVCTPTFRSQSGRCCSFLTAASLLLVVPTPGGLGAVETGMVGVLALFSVAPEVALGVALVDRSISFWGLIVTGLPVFLVSKHTK